VYVPEVLGEVWDDGGGVLDCRAPTAACAMAPLCASPRKCSWHASSSEHSTCSCIPHSLCHAAGFCSVTCHSVLFFPALTVSSLLFPLGGWVGGWVGECMGEWAGGWAGGWVSAWASGRVSE